HRDLVGIEEALAGRATRVTHRRLHRRKRYLLPDGAEVEAVRPMHNTEFCMNCTRLRLTSDGRLKPCLMRDDNLIDVLTPMRQGATADDIRGLFLEAVKRREPFWCRFTGPQGLRTRPPSP
ncbi:TPA: hypothetical protein EYP44_01170, partial [Candidatus Bathyarchaeota archaeon]|nr:hypothetical protein [Candidatus Bathyarchaeota archaeon]